MKNHLPLIVFAALAIVGLALAYPVASHGDYIYIDGAPVWVQDSSNFPSGGYVYIDGVPRWVMKSITPARHASYGSSGGYATTVVTTTRSYGSSGGYSYGGSGGTPTQVLPRPLPIVQRLRSLLARPITIIEVTPEAPAAPKATECRCGCDCPGCKCGKQPVDAKPNDGLAEAVAALKERNRINGELNDKAADVQKRLDALEAKQK